MIATEKIRDELQRRMEGTVRLDVPLAPHTSFNIGGPADLWIEPRDLKDLAAAVKLLHHHEYPVTVLGLGSNALVADKGIRGAVICLKRSFKNVEIEGETVTAGAGVTMPLLSQQVSRRGLSGYEWACGIPGSVGGGAVMNAGAHGGETAECVIQLQTVRRDGEDAWVDAGSLGYMYRSSTLRRGGTIVAACRFRFHRDDEAAIRERLRNFREKRQIAQPETSQCAGSIFKNPPGASAGRLLESLGAKGMRVGGAEVSEKHANFIVNAGGASAADVRALIARLQGLAAERAGVELETEVLFVGDWN